MKTGRVQIPIDENLCQYLEGGEDRQEYSESCQNFVVVSAAEPQNKNEQGRSNVDPTEKSELCPKTHLGQIVNESEQCASDGISRIICSRQAAGRLRKGSFRPLRPFAASNE